MYFNTRGVTEPAHKTKGDCSMKAFTVIAAVALLSSAPALGQAPAEKKPAAAAPAAKPADKPAAAAPAPKPADNPAAAAPAAKPAEAPAAKPVEKPEAAPVAKPVEKPAEKPVRKASRSRDTRDARGCLQLATNKEIIVCAQKYR